MKKKEKLWALCILCGYLLDQFRLERKHVFKPQTDALGWKYTKGKDRVEDPSGRRINR